MKTNKISIIGAGYVGSTTAFAIMEDGLASEIVIVDVDRKKAMGEAMDLAHSASFVPAADVREGTMEETAGSDLIIVTAGAGPKEGESRLDLVDKNLKIMKQIIPEAVKYSPNTVLLIVSNPVDILSYAAYRYSGLPASRVLGSGTVLDTSRFKYMLAKHFDIDPRNIHGFIIGEHGDSEIAPYSLVSIAGMSVKDYQLNVHHEDNPNLEEMIRSQVKDAAYEIIQRKGYTNYAIALAVRRISEAILRDEKSILTVSTMVEGKDLYCSLPCVLGRQGIEKNIPVTLSSHEQASLDDSMTVLKEILDHYF